MRSPIWKKNLVMSTVNIKKVFPAGFHDWNPIKQIRNMINS